MWGVNKERRREGSNKESKEVSSYGTGGSDKGSKERSRKRSREVSSYGSGGSNLGIREG